MIKNKVIPLLNYIIKHYAMKAYEGAFFTLAPNGGEWPASFPCPFTPGNRGPGTLDMRLGRSQSRSGGYGGEKNLLPCRESTPGSPVGSLVAVSTK
jgi:hypothetical protein